ncbi:MAG: membrane dipeptidase [Rhodobiaceae bacterium]|nr:membrane dipeptidase [Rhodobiaceae bacterium]
MGVVNLGFLFVRYLVIIFFISYSQQLRAEYLTLDSHIDIPFDYMINPEHDPGNNTDMQVDFQKMLEGNLDGGFFIVYVGQSELNKNGYQEAKEKAIIKFNAINKMVEKYPNKIVLVKSPEEVYEAKRDKKLFAAIGIENGYVIGEDIELLKYYYDLGARYMTLSHIGHNQISDSSLPKKSLNNDIEMHGGLSNFGKITVKKMNELGMMIDISHVSDKSALQAIKLSHHPVIASHSGARSVADHPRNIPDNIIREIAKKGGVVQVVAFSSYVKVNKKRTESIINLRDSILTMTGDNNFIPEKHMKLIEYKNGMDKINKEFPLPGIDSFIDHIDHIVDLVGIDYVGISSDFGGGGGIEGWSNASQTFNITNSLLLRGYSKDEVNKIWSENFLRVWKNVSNNVIN